MPKRSSKPKKPPSDVNALARFSVDEATTEPGVEPPVSTALLPPAEKNAAAVALGRLGGLKGGNARAAALSASRRKAIARKAAQSRWKQR